MGRPESYLDSWRADRTTLPVDTTPLHEVLSSQPERAAGVEPFLDPLAASAEVFLRVQLLVEFRGL